MDTPYVTVVISKLRKLGADVNFIYKNDGYTPLIKAAIECNIIAIRALISSDCDINKRLVKTYSTPRSFMSRRKKPPRALDIALKIPNYHIALILLICGAKRTSLARKILQGLQPFQNVDDSTDLIELKRWLEEPRSLKFFCRKKVRRTYKENVTVILDNIEYPKILKDYLRTKTL